MKLTRTSAVLVTALVVALAAVALPVAGSLATPNPPDPDTKNRAPSEGADFQVTPDDHTPDTTTAYTMLSRGEGPWDGSEGLQQVDYYKITTQETRFKDCAPSDAQAFGIDRDNDAEGTATDTGLLRHMEQYSVSGRVISVNIYEEDDLGGSPTYLNDTDETVARLANCVVTPSEPGWYQFKGYVNGTNYEGNFQEVLLYSKYFYICDCSSEAEAEEKLGPKPYSEDGSTDGDSGSDSATATPTATATPERGGSSGSSSTATPTATATATATATPTATATATATPTAAQGGGSSGESSDDSGDATATATATQTAASGGGSAATATRTAASGGGGGSGSGQQAQRGGSGAQDRVTPTAGSGPGFGALAALGGLLAGGLLVRRRD